MSYCHFATILVILVVTSSLSAQENRASFSGQDGPNSGYFAKTVQAVTYQFARIVDPPAQLGL
jgi:hypothetical protein